MVNLPIHGKQTNDSKFQKKKVNKSDSGLGPFLLFSTSRRHLYIQFSYCINGAIMKKKHILLAHDQWEGDYLLMDIANLVSEVL